MKVRGYIILVFSLIVLSFLSYKFSSQKSNPDIRLPKPALKYNLYKDISYNSNSGNSWSKLDIYQPKTPRKGKLPAVIYIHGGAWDNGDKSMILNNFRGYVLEELLNNQYTVISINYTLLDKKNHLEKTLEDCKIALKWIKENADEYNLDIDNLGVWGGSSGAHIAMLTAYAQDKNDKGPAYPKLKYAINYYGPTDLNKLYKTNANNILLDFFRIYSPDAYKTRQQKISQLTGFDINTQKEEARKKLTEFSPITYINKGTVPTLIFHGTNDDIVDISQSELLKQALEKNKIYHEYYVINSAKHTFSNINLHEAQDVARKTVDFINIMTKETNSVD